MHALPQAPMGPPLHRLSVLPVLPGTPAPASTALTCCADFPDAGHAIEPGPCVLSAAIANSPSSQCPVRPAGC
uniref:Putative secreted protein n=1 Tax=Anopheles triannulatus TaxID=58253 RepID=A0A2M4B7I8_9DIPT